MTPFPSDLQGTFLCTWSQGGLLNFENEECSGLLSLIWVGPSLPPHPTFSFCSYGFSVHRGETVQSAAHLSPASVLPAGPPSCLRHSQHSQSWPSLPIAHMLSDLEKGE